MLLTPDLCIDDLLLRLDFRNQPDVIDISPEGGAVSTLQLSRLECLSSDKVRLFNMVHVPWPLTSSFLGRVSVLLPAAIPRPFPRVLIGYRWHPAAPTIVGITEPENLPFALPTGAAPAAEEP